MFGRRGRWRAAARRPRSSRRLSCSAIASPSAGPTDVEPGVEPHVHARRAAAPRPPSPTRTAPPRQQARARGPAASPPSRAAATRAPSRSRPLRRRARRAGAAPHARWWRPGWSRCGRGPGRGSVGQTGRLPVATTTACRARSVVVADPVTVPRAGEPARPADQRDPAPSSPVDLARVVPVVGDRVAPRSTASDVEYSRRSTPGSRRAATTGVGRAQQRLARHARPVRALAADQLATPRGPSTGRPRCA